MTQVARAEPAPHSVSLVEVIHRGEGGMAGLINGLSRCRKNGQDAEELANAEVTGQSGAGLVSVVMTGRHDVKRISLVNHVLRSV